MIEKVLFIVVGSLVGSIVTYLTERLRRLHCYIDDWSMYVEEDIDGVIQAEAPGGVSYHLTIKFFNRKSKAIGLHRVRFAFGTRFTTRYENDRVDVYLVNSEGKQSYSGGDITLAPNTWTKLQCFASTKKEDRHKFADCTHAWFAAEMENGRKYRKRIPKTTSPREFAET